MHAANRTEYPEQPFVCALCTVAISDREELCSHIVKHSDQIAAFTKENVDSDKLVPSAVDVPNVTDKKPPSGAKYNVDVVERNRLILTRLAQPAISFADIETSTHDCQISHSSVNS